MNLKDYFSNLSCWEEFEIKVSLLGKEKNDLEILQNFRKIDSFYYTEISGLLVFMDEEGNKVDVSEMTLDGYLNISKTNLTSLKGCPKKVSSGFYCSYCKSLTSLEGAPKEVGGIFDCSNCKSLTSLEGAPKKVGMNFYCFNCPKISKDEIPDCEIGGKLYR